MRKIRIMAHISMDGIIQPTGTGRGDEYENGGWSAPYRGLEGLEAVIEAQGAKFDLLLGRRTYDLWAGYWPNAGTSPLADSINGAMKYVATHRPESLSWGPAGDLGTDIVTGIRNVKSTDGSDIITWGSATLVPVLLALGLIDEVVLIVYPLLLGQGIHLFPQTADRHELVLISTKATSTGALINTYRYVGSLRK